MFQRITERLKNLALIIASEEGEVRKKVYKTPLLKPPRRNPEGQNKTNRTDYMKNYMKEYRGDGKDYQKVPDKVKQFRKEQRRKLKEKLKKGRPFEASLIDQELSMWQKLGKAVDLNEFEFMCDRRGFNEEERKILAEELCDLDLIII